MTTALFNGSPQPGSNGQLIDSQLVFRQTIELIAETNIGTLINTRQHGRKQEILFISV